MLAEVGPDTVVLPTAPRALVVMALGEAYLAKWNRLCRRSVEDYAARHGYDVLLVTRPLDDSPRARARSPAWQKCLILSQPWSRLYRRLVWLDADILIHPHAPDVCEGVPDARVGAAISRAQLSHAQRHAALEVLYGQRLRPEEVDAAWAARENRIYRDDGIETGEGRIVQTGVLVLSPPHHAPLLARAYAFHSDQRWYEQAILSHLILSEGLLHELSPRFNWLAEETLDYYFQGLTPEEVAARAELFRLLFLGEYMRAWFFHLSGLAWQVL